MTTDNTAARCVKCGHDEDVNNGGLCQHWFGKFPQEMYPCNCHCVFPNTQSQDEGAAVDTEMVYRNHLLHCSECADGSLCDGGVRLWKANGQRPANIRSEEIGSLVVGELPTPEQRDNESLVQLLCESYGRSLLYPNNRTQHELANACKDEMLKRLSGVHPRSKGGEGAVVRLIKHTHHGFDCNKRVNGAKCDCGLDDAKANALASQVESEAATWNKAIEAAADLVFNDGHDTLAAIIRALPPPSKQE